MTSRYISKTLRQRVTKADGERCAYCQTPAWIIGHNLDIDHIHPISKGGQSTFSNLCLACRRCNRGKWDHTTAIDPLSGLTVRLFHPRVDQWVDHFKWVSDGRRIEGVTAIGHATLDALNMNHPAVVRSRDIWVESGWHPPT